MKATRRRELANPDYKGQPFTDFASVTPDTPLESLNLNWRERDLPETPSRSELPATAKEGSHA